MPMPAAFSSWRSMLTITMSRNSKKTHASFATFLSLRVASIEVMSLDRGGGAWPSMASAAAKLKTRAAPPANCFG